MLASGSLNEIACDQFGRAGFACGVRAGIARDQAMRIGVARMEDDRHLELHEQIGQRIDFAIGQLDIEDRDIGSLALDGLYTFCERGERAFDGKAEVLGHV